MSSLEMRRSYAEAKTFTIKMKGSSLGPMLPPVPVGTWTPIAGVAKRKIGPKEGPTNMGVFLYSWQHYVERLALQDDIDPNVEKFIIETAKNLRENYSDICILPQWVHKYSNWNRVPGIEAHND